MRAYQIVAVALIATATAACGQSSGRERSSARTAHRTTSSTVAVPESTTTTAPPVTTTLPSPCAAAVAWSDAAAHTGERMSVTGPVMSASWHADVAGAPTFVNLGRDYPDPSRMQLVIWGEHRAAFPGGSPESLFPTGSTVCATGTVTSYRGVPEIILSAPSDTTVVSAPTTTPPTYDDPGYDPTYDDPGYDDPSYDQPDPCDIYDC